MITTTTPPAIALAEAAHPRKIVIPQAAGLAWGNEPGYLYQVKADGEFCTRALSPGNVLVGELLPGGIFVAFDCLSYAGQDLRELPLSTRLEPRDLLAATMGVGTIQTARRGERGGEFLQWVWSVGLEGVVRKRLDSLWADPMEACKRTLILECLITGRVAGTQSVTIADPVTGQPRGAVALRGGKADKIRIGSRIRVEGMCLHDSGKIREPRPCREWLVKY